MIMPGGSRKTQHGREMMSDSAKMMQHGRVMMHGGHQHGHEVMKPGDPWKTQHGREKMPGGRRKL